MGFPEIKRAMASLSANERAELRAYSRLLDLKENPNRQAQLFAALDRARAGDVVSEFEVRRRMSQSS